MPSQASSSALESGSSPSARGDTNWHYSFDIPWSKLPTSIRKLLDKEQKPSHSQRLEIIRIMVDEIMVVCNNPGKKHMTEIARKMVVRYPKSFRDEIEGQVVGGGCGSLVKQLVSRADNQKRLQAPVKRLSESASSVDAKKMRTSAYGCINPNPELPVGESKQMQKEKQEELKKMFEANSKDAKKMERLMVETFPSQRRDMAGQMETEEVVKEWPWVYQEVGMSVHFRLLTGIQMDSSFEEAAGSKFRRVLRYFQFIETKPSSRAGTILSEALAGGDEACAAVLLLLAHFKEEDKMFFTVNDTDIAVEVDTTKLPATPCIVVCGKLCLNLLCLAAAHPIGMPPFAHPPKQI